MFPRHVPGALALVGRYKVVSTWGFAGGLERHRSEALFDAQNDGSVVAKDGDQTKCQQFIMLCTLRLKHCGNIPSGKHKTSVLRSHCYTNGDASFVSPDLAFSGLLHVGGTVS